MTRAGLQRAMLVTALLCASLALTAHARAQSLKLQLESSDVYAELPFVLALSAEGFDEDPVPEAPDLAIDGCRVWFLGASPNVVSGVRIINGKRSEWRQVSYTFRYRVEAPRAGSYTVPPLTVTQGRKSASTRQATFNVKAISATPDMKLRLVLPERPVWVGETFEVKIEWLLRRDVGDYNFVVPLFDLDAVQVQPGPQASGRTLAFNAGARSVDLPYAQDSVTVGGTRYTRLRFDSLVTVNRTGTFEVEPAKVAANLEGGTRRDSFGFRVPRYDLFKAEDKKRRLTVRALPLEGRPPSFQSAIGSAYSIAVQASRTVVRVGDPIQLKVHVRGDGPLEGLSLPRLSGEGGLPEASFSVPDETAVGVLDDGGQGKTFDVTVRIKNDSVTEIPPLAFSYFDPVAGAYRTIRSDPIALSVTGSSVVGAADVATANPPGGDRSATGTTASVPAATGGQTSPSTLVGADLSLSAPESTLRSRWTPGGVAPLIVALYLLPLAVLGIRLWQVRTEGRRGLTKETRRALRRVEAALDSGRPAMEAAPQIVAAVRELARITGRRPEQAAAALERLETHAFDPEAGERPLAAEHLEPVRDAARDWAGSVGEPRPTRRAAVSLLLGALVLGGAASAIRAATDGDQLGQARESYRRALEEQDRARRTLEFAEAERAFAVLVARHPSSPELLADWGNAALGSQEIGRAVLAYRRALRLEPGNARAAKNLAWVRARFPEWLPRPRTRGVMDSLFFWHHRLSLTQRQLIGALAFAGALLLLAPWRVRRTRLLRRLAILLAVVWLATAGSAALDVDPSREAVVLADGTPLRSADSLGAPPSLTHPLPAGTEVRIVERRDAWSRVALADGTRGWVAASTLESIVP